MKRSEMKRQRREAEKKTKTYVLTVREIEKIKEQAVADAVNLSCPLMFGLTGLVMRDKWGFGPIRMKRLMDQLMDSYESFALGYVSIEDTLAALRDETGYNIIEMIAEIDERAAKICKKSRALKKLTG